MVCDAKDSLGRKFKAKLIKGAFKKLANNPQREDEEKYVYCPLEQVEPEIETLLRLYENAQTDKINPLIIASWFHHAFTTIHPFQDGNGRMARLLASLVLIKNGLFPLTVCRDDKKDYIDGLIKADNGDPGSTVDFFCKTQKKSMESVLNLVIDDGVSQSTISEVASIFAKKVNGWKEEKFQNKQKIIAANRNYVFDQCSQYLNLTLKTLRDQIPADIADIRLENALPENTDKYYWFTHQIIEYAKGNEYFFNRNLPRGWFCFNIHIRGGMKYAVIISVHHYGYDDTTLAIGGILEAAENDSQEKSYSPVKLRPYTLSLVSDEIENIKGNLSAHLQQVISIGFAEIINEIE